MPARAGLFYEIPHPNPEVDVIDLLLAADLADSNALVVIAGAAATALTTLTGVLVSQISSMRSELQSHRDAQAAAMKVLADRQERHDARLADLEADAEISSTRNRRPRTGRRTVVPKD